MDEATVKDIRLWKDCHTFELGQLDRSRSLWQIQVATQFAIFPRLPRQEQQNGGKFDSAALSLQVRPSAAACQQTPFQPRFILRIAFRTHSDLCQECFLLSSLHSIKESTFDMKIHNGDHLRHRVAGEHSTGSQNLWLQFSEPTCLQNACILPGH